MLVHVVSVRAESFSVSVADTAEPFWCRYEHRQENHATSLDLHLQKHMVHVCCTRYIHLQYSVIFIVCLAWKKKKKGLCVESRCILHLCV